MAEENITKTAEEAQKTEEVDYKAEYLRIKEENERLKNGISKTNSEISKVKKELADRLSEQEKAEREKAEKDAERDALLQEYIARDRVNTYTAKLIEGGYDAATAATMARALPDGVPDEYFATMKEFAANAAQKAKTAALDNLPKPTPGGVPTPADASLDRMLKAAGVK